MKKLLLGSCTATAFGLSSGLAVAADPPMVIDDLEETVTVNGKSFTVWVGGTYFNAPVANGLGSVGDAGSFLFIQQTDPGATLDAFGVSGGVEGWLHGDRLGIYFSLEGDWVRDTAATVMPVPAAVFVDTLPITGAVSPGASFFAPAGTNVDSASTVDYGRVDGTLGVAIGDLENVDVALGLFGSSSVLHLVSSVTNPASAADFIRLDETVSTFSVGPVVVATVERDLTERVSGFLTGRGALLWAQGTLNATQTADNLPVAGLAVTSTRGAIAGVVEVEGGFDIAVGERAKFSFFGTLGARNDYFSIVNPRSGPGLDANDPASYNPGPASLAQNVLFEATVGVGFGAEF